MIGSHDSFTYLKSTNWFYNMFSGLWRTQNKSIIEQYKAGIRFFDIRIRRDKKHGEWVVCHGLADLKARFYSMWQICDYIEQVAPEAIYRIVLERGSDTKFVADCDGICEDHPNLWRVDVKSSKQWMGCVANNNQKLYDRGYKFALKNTWESPAYELHGKIDSSNFYKTNLRDEAKKINDNLAFFKDPDSLKAMIESKDELYFLDYCTGEYR